MCICLSLGEGKDLRREGKKKVHWLIGCCSCRLSNGAAVRLQGVWKKSGGKGQSHELQVSKAELLGENDAMVRALLIV